MQGCTSHAGKPSKSSFRDYPGAAYRVRFSVVGFAIVLALNSFGCALTNESSAAKRADTYDVATSFRINPRTGTFEYTSTGDDELHAKNLKVGENSIESIDIIQKRSPVVIAQGQRAKDITELMGQQIALNQVWGQMLAQVMEGVRDVAGQVVGLRKSMIETEAAREAATRTLISEAINAALAARGGTPAPVSDPAHP